MKSGSPRSRPAADMGSRDPQTSRRWSCSRRAYHANFSYLSWYSCRMGEGFAFDAFVSDGTRLHPRVLGLVARLRAAGIRIWFDDAGGLHRDTYTHATRQALELSRAWVICLLPGVPADLHTARVESQVQHPLIHVLI